MKDKIKEFRLNITIPAVFTMVIGILLLVFPVESLATISKVIAAIIILSGIFVVVNQLIEHGVDNALGIAVGLMILIVGIWLFNDSGKIISIIPIAIGVILVIHGVQDLGMAVEAARAKASNFWISFVLAAVKIGVMLIWDGITDFGIVHSVRKATGSVVDGTITREEDI